MPFKLVNDFPNDILNETEAPFISLYQPTHRHFPDNQQDPIRYKNLVKEIEQSLLRGYSKREIAPIMERFNALMEDQAFWNHTLDGLAILATKNRGVLYKLQRPVKELAIVADSFHIKPLIRIFQSADRFQVLGLSRGEFALYEGNRYGFAPLELDPDVPRTAEDVLRTDYDERYFSAGVRTGGGAVAAFHSYGDRKEAIDKDTERFFRFVDRFVTEKFSKPSGLPLILVALDEHHGVFRAISQNPHLMENGIRTAFDAVKIEEMHKTIWEVVEPVYLAKTKELVDAFHEARSRFMATDDLSTIARAAWEKRIATLLVDADKVLPGKVVEPGRIVTEELAHPDVDDVLDDLAELVYNAQGHVVALPKERMPGDTGAAAILRF